jgi:threonine dehydratase
MPAWLAAADHEHDPDRQEHVQGTERPGGKAARAMSADNGTGTGDSVLSAIGGTPLVELGRVTRGLEGRILAKLEYLNPGGSKKDRIALRMIEDAERSGGLRPGQTVVELTSGNTGTGLAIVCAVTGHPFVAVMSQATPRSAPR